MNAPMVGSWVVDVQAVRPFTIHGDLYYELHVTRRDDAGGGQVLALKVPAHAISDTPAAGQTLSVTFLMGQGTAAKPTETA
jgi:hypothetical protein